MVGNAISCLMIAVRTSQQSASVADAQLEAAVQRIAEQLYVKAHVDAPPTATDFGRGLYNILV